jgi:high-affinity Fe2+/Pb2+ permease
VNPGASQEVVITSIVNTQWRIAAMNAAIALVAALLFGGGVWYWNRSLAEEGDPAQRGVDQPDPNHPARKVVR